MEKGFFHPSRGYWQTLEVPSEEILEDYPEGTEEVPLRPGAAFEWDGSAWVETEPDPSITIAAYKAAIDRFIETKAGERQYTSGVHAASYVTSTNLLWAAEAQAFVAWRDAVWAHSIALLEQVQGGNLAAPTIDDVLAGLPTLIWPEV